jgi:hypothetical protein
MRLVPIKIGAGSSFWCLEIENDGEKDEMVKIIEEIEENEIKAFLSRTYHLRNRKFCYWVVKKSPN